MAQLVTIDFETRSAVDLRKIGVHRYAEDASTAPWCMAYAFDDEPVQLWKLGDPLPQDLADHVAAGGLVEAHNAAFELSVWNLLCVPRYGWPPLSIAQCRCTMAMAANLALPRALGNLAPVLGLATNKDKEGTALMLRMARPRKTLEDGTHVWWDTTDKRERLYAYCKTDVEVERLASKAMRALSEKEQKVWELDQEINNRGIGIDLAAVRGGIRVAQQTAARINEAIAEVTDYEVLTYTAAAALTAWLKKETGRDIDSIDKASMRDMLASEGLTPKARRALELRREGARSSVAKLQAMLDGASADGRARGTLQYYGADTGRWSGRRIQPQNVPRGSGLLKPEDADAVAADLASGDAAFVSAVWGPPMTVLSDSLRSMLVAAPGKRFIASDLAQIEARMLAWLANEWGVVEAFRAYDAGTGPDLYKVTAAGIYHVHRPEDVTKDQRQIGKVAALALGYGGGVGAFTKMAAGYGTEVSDEEADEIKNAWRAANAKIVQLWKDLERCATDAVKHRNTVFTVGTGKIAFRYSEGYLRCRLPSGHVLSYPNPRLEDKETKFGMRTCLVYDAKDQYTNKWGPVQLWGGLIAENATQATSRDVLVDGMFRLEAAGYPVVMHVHDEVVTEVPEGFGSVAEVEHLLGQSPEWAPDLPVTSSGWEGRRYRK